MILGCTFPRTQQQIACRRDVAIHRDRAVRHDDCIPRNVERGGSAVEGAQRQCAGIGQIAGAEDRPSLQGRDHSLDPLLVGPDILSGHQIGLATNNVADACRRRIDDAAKD